MNPYLIGALAATAFFLMRNSGASLYAAERARALNAKAGKDQTLAATALYYWVDKAGKTVQLPLGVAYTRSKSADPVRPNPGTPAEIALRIYSAIQERRV